jgi:hypothetical protein
MRVYVKQTQTVDFSYLRRKTCSFAPVQVQLQRATCLRTSECFAFIFRSIIYAPVYHFLTHTKTNDSAADTKHLYIIDLAVSPLPLPGVGVYAQYVAHGHIG